jgi:acyl-CoA thioesterase
MWSGDLASKALGMTLDHVGPGEACMSMVVREDMINGWELCHGGIIASLADSAFAFACNSRGVVTVGVVTVAAGFDITFVEPARLGDVLVATAQERSLRGRSGVYDVTVTCAGSVVAEFRGRSRALGGPHNASGTLQEDAAADT